jgi:hypothetical protein
MCPSVNQEGGVVPEFTIGNYLATRLEQIGIKHYFMVSRPRQHPPAPDHLRFRASSQAEPGDPPPKTARLADRA